jgi:putative oxidoreductase
MAASSLAHLFPAARALMAIPFLLSGGGKMMEPLATASYMASSGLPESASLAVAIGALELLAALALMAGYHARRMAFALAAFTTVATLLFHAFWREPVGSQLVHQLFFTKNIAIVGGLLFVAAAGAGPWSLDSRRTAHKNAFNTASEV